MGGKFSSEIAESKENRGVDLVLRNQDSLKKKEMAGLLSALESELPNLQSLGLINCKAKALPSSIWTTLAKLQQLSAISLEDNLLSELPESNVSHIGKKLVELQLSGNRFSVFPKEVVSKLPLLQNLDLSRNGLKSIGEFSCVSLRKLKLSHNQMTEIPEAICALANLESLEMQFNLVTSIPASISKTKLNHLDLSHNKITLIPPSIGDCISLTSLNVSNNEITGFPASMANLINLKKLRLSHCTLTLAPSFVSNLSQLQILSLNGNQIEKMPGEYSKLKELIQLDLQENLLTELPAEIGQLSNLKRLHLEFNKISSLPVEMKDLKKLVGLNLHHNELTSVPQFLKQMKTLLRFSIDFNPLDEQTLEIVRTETSIGILEKEHYNTSLRIRVMQDSGPGTLHTSHSAPRIPIGFANRVASESNLMPSSRKSYTVREGANHLSMMSLSEVLRGGGGEKESVNLTLRKPSRTDWTEESFPPSYHIQSEPASPINISISEPKSEKGALSETMSFDIKSTSSSAKSSPKGSLRRIPTDLGLSLAMIDTGVMGRSNRDSRENTGIPAFSKFKEAFDSILEDQNYSKERQEVMNKISLEQKWSLVKEHKPTSVALLMKYDSGRKSRHFAVVQTGRRGAVRPGDYVTLLARGRPSKEELSSLLKDLSSNIDGFNLTFIETGGLQLLLKIIEKRTPLKSNQKDSSDALVLLEAIKCFGIATEFSSSVILSTTEAVNIVGLNFDSPNEEVSAITLKFLEEICTVPHVGRDQVLAAIQNHYNVNKRSSSNQNSPTNSEKEKEQLHMSKLIQLLEMATDKENTEMVHTIMSLINRLHSYEPDLESRFDLRNQFINLGILQDFKEMHDLEVEKISAQVDLFEEHLFNDEEDMIDKYGKLSVWERKQRKESLKHGNFAFITALVRPQDKNDNSAIMSFEPSTKVSSLMRDCKKEFSPRHHKDLTFGLFVPQKESYWLDENKTMEQHGLKGQVYVEYSMKSFQMQVLNVISDETKSFALEPSLEVCEVLRKLLATEMPSVATKHSDDYGLYFPPEKSQTLEPNEEIPASQIGVVLDGTKKLYEYVNQIIETKIPYLQFKMKPTVVKLVLARDTETHYFNPAAKVKFVKRALLNPRENEADYGLFAVSVPHSSATSFAVAGTGIWLDDNKPIGSYSLNETTPVKMKILPRSFRVLSAVSEKEKTATVTLDMSINTQLIIELISSLYFQLPVNEETHYVLSWKTRDDDKETVLSPYFPLKDQDLPPPEKDVVLVLRQKENGGEELDDVNIWDDKEPVTYEDETKEKKMISYATFNKLVECATSLDELNNEFTDVFYLCYQSFSSPQQLLNKLVERYNTPYSLTEAEASRIKLRVLIFIKHWINSAYEEHSEELLANIKTFLDKSAESDSQFGHLTQGIQVKKEKRSSSSSAADTPSKNPHRLTRLNPDNWTLFDIEPMDFAKQTTMRAFSAFQRIHHTEFFNQSWTKLEAARKFSPNLLATIEFFNDISTLTQTAIVTTKKIRDRVKVWEYFIKVAVCYRDLKNFHLLTAIISAFSTSPTLRLNWTREKLSKKAKQDLTDLETLMDMRGSFKRYREVLKESDFPCLPYIGVYLTDLIFIEEGNPLKIGRRINFSRAVYIHNIISAVQRYQQSPYNHTIVTSIQSYIAKMPRILEQDIMYKASLEIEPRGATRNDIQ